MEYDDLSDYEKGVYNDIDFDLTKLFDIGRRNILKVLCSKYGVKNG